MNNDTEKCTNIFEIFAERNNIHRDAERINQLLYNESVVEFHSWPRTFINSVDEFAFRNWKHRGRSINLNDFLDTIDIDDILFRAHSELDSMFLIIEIIYNLWNILNNVIQNHSADFIVLDAFNDIKNLIDGILSQYNMKPYYLDDEKIIIIEDDSAVALAVQTVKQDVAIDIIRYKHRSMQGDIGQKRQILSALGNEIEPNRSVIEKIYSKLSSDIFFALNNMNIRHNNIDDGVRFNTEFAKMSIEQIEKYYDVLFNKILLAILLIEDKHNGDFMELRDKFKC